VDTGTSRAPGAAPDFCEPVHGWRLWFVVVDGGRSRLMSPVYPTIWRPGEELEATCDARRRELLRPWRLRPAEHAAPEPRCCCGVHAVSRPGDLAAYVPSVAARRIVHRVIGRVSLWGDVVEGARGWRAAYAYPKDLYVPEVHVNRRRLRGLEAMAVELADYGVAVRICEGMAARDVVDDLADRLAPWRRRGAAAA
jgi:hypothetical protein